MYVIFFNVHYVYVLNHKNVITSYELINELIILCDSFEIL